MARAVIRAGPTNPGTGWSTPNPQEVIRFELMAGQSFDGEIGIMGDGSTIYVIKFAEADSVTAVPLSPLAFPIKGLTGPTSVIITAQVTAGATRYPFAYFSGSLGRGA